MEQIDRPIIMGQVAFTNEATGEAYTEARRVMDFGNGWAVYFGTNAVTVTSLTSGRALIEFENAAYARGCAKSISREVSAQMLEYVQFKQAKKTLLTHSEYELMGVVGTILKEWKDLEALETNKGDK